MRGPTNPFRSSFISSSSSLPRSPNSSSSELSYVIPRRAGELYRTIRQSEHSSRKLTWFPVNTSALQSSGKSISLAMFVLKLPSPCLEDIYRRDHWQCKHELIIHTSSSSSLEMSPSGFDSFIFDFALHGGNCDGTTLLLGAIVNIASIFFFSTTSNACLTTISLKSSIPFKI